MKRKLFSTLLCAFALLLLMGAGVEPDSTAAIVIEEESTGIAQDEQVLETGDPAGQEQSEEELAQSEDEDGQLMEEAEENADPGMPPVALPVAVDPGFLIDGQPAPLETCREMQGSVTYVALSATVQALAPGAQSSWDGATRTVTVTAPGLTLTAKADQFYVVANGRYLYVEDGVQVQDGRVMVPLRVLTEAFGATHTWDRATDTVNVKRGSGTLAPGDQFYNQDALFWLSRVIYAESGNQPLKGQIAVGNVIMNRVESPIFPNTIIDVLSQKNQFSTYRGGKLANRTPNQSSIIAAKLVLDGAVVEETEGALYFDSLVKSWASRHKTYVATIGGHKFYR